MADTIFGIDAATVETFDRAYILSRDPEVQKLHSGEVGLTNPDGSPQVPLHPAERYALALELAPTHDVYWQIDALGSDPYFSMMQLQMGGFTEIYSYLRNTPMKVSTNPADFPPYPTEPVEVPPTSTALVGALAYDNVYYATQTAINQAKAGTLINGQLIRQDGAIFRFQVSQGMMGASYTWLKQ